MPEKGLEEETPKVIDSLIPFVDEAEKKEAENKEEEKKEIEENKIERKETKTTDTSLEETKEPEQEKKKEYSPSSQPEGSKKTNTPLVKRKLDLEKESEKKKAKLTISTISEVEAEEEKEEKEGEEEEDLVIDTKKMTPKQLMKVSKKLRIQAEKAKVRAKKKKARILNTTKTILSDLIPDIVVDENASIIDQLGTLVKAIGSEATDLEKVAARQYETRRGEKLMEQISAKKVALSNSTEEVKSILKEVGQLLVKL